MSSTQAFVDAAGYVLRAAEQAGFPAARLWLHDQYEWFVAPDAASWLEFVRHEALNPTMLALALRAIAAAPRYVPPSPTWAIPHPAPPPPPRAPARPKLTKRCRACQFRYVPDDQDTCSRCIKSLRESEATPDEPLPPPPHHACIACGHRFEDLRSYGPRLCATCLQRQAAAPDADDGVRLEREIGGFPHSDFHLTRRGEWVIAGHVLPHARPNESRWDRFGDTPEWGD